MPAVDEFARREAPGAALAADGERLARAGRAMADRFRAGATLFAFGSATGAQHVAVEFVHPVIVGKRALPAIAVAPVQLPLLAKAGDIAIALGADGDALRTATDLGLLTIALVGQGEQEATTADHVFVAQSDDPLVVDEVHVTTYHLLWELTHVFLEHAEEANAVIE